MIALDYQILKIGNIINKICSLKDSKDYILVKNHQNNIVCLTYNLKACKSLIVEYFKKTGLDKHNVILIRKVISERDVRLSELIKYKLVVLDDELCLYKDVEEKSKNYIIEGLDRSFPKFGLNRFYTISKK